jgi:acyl-CoA thioesterase FadM
MTLDCEMLDEHGKAVAKGSAVVVAYDYTSSTSVPVPDWARARIEEYEGRQLSRA